ncbi:hypothetical protein PIB30_012925 [Stylosanthes scabra]|uniref:Ubiquitin-like protease family profile domain-containing protein n=1 Tax=Stylosanthes scabra TaxID=79078 RepID=A0ABU6Y844_9FABA|nr:hypothetical protein [Stylosanthes scabra]
MEPPSFDMGVEPHLLTPQTMDAIEEIDDQLPATEKSKLGFPMQQRMFEKYEHRWRDPKSRKPHEISTLLNIDEYLGYMEKDRLQSHRFLFAPVLCFEHWWLYVLDVEKKHLFVLD